MDSNIANNTMQADEIQRQIIILNDSHEQELEQLLRDMK